VSSLNVLDKPNEFGAIDKSQSLVGGKPAGAVGIPAGGDQDAAISAIGRNDAEKLSHLVNADLAVSPSLALDQHGFPVSAKNEVDSSVGASASGLFNVVALAPVGFADKLFKCLPCQIADGINVALVVKEPSARHRADRLPFTAWRKGSRSVEIPAPPLAAAGCGAGESICHDPKNKGGD